MPFNSNHFSTPNRDIPDADNLRWNHKETKQEHRSDFAKDRDRILYSKSFLRLRGKTQVFMLQKNDYIRTRMTHSLEVNQLAKSIASALGQNVELVEAIALGHDVGHTPFGHVGERTIAKMLTNDDDTPEEKRGFKHNLQALRLLCDLEKGADYPISKGLNLTKYTLWGISHHSSIKRKLDEVGNPLIPIKTEHPVYDSYLNAIDSYWSFESLIVALADEIAQRHHDIEDSLRYGIISRNVLLEEIKIFDKFWGKAERSCFKRLTNEVGNLDDPVFNSLFARLVANMYVTHTINNSKDNLRNLSNEYNINNKKDFLTVKEEIPEDTYLNCISMGKELNHQDEIFQGFLKTNVLGSYQAQAMDGKAEYIIRKLFKAFCDNPKQLPDTSLCSYAGYLGARPTRSEALSNIDEDKAILHRCIADYIGGMTDKFAYDEFDRLYGTRI